MSGFTSDSDDSDADGCDVLEEPQSVALLLIPNPARCCCTITGSLRHCLLKNTCLFAFHFREKIVPFLFLDMARVNK